MQTQERSVYKRKPKHCPQCLSKAIADYVFGYPNGKVINEQFLPYVEQKFQIGGCSIEFNKYQKTWHCKTCGHDFYKENPDFIEWNETSK